MKPMRKSRRELLGGIAFGTLTALAYGAFAAVGIRFALPFGSQRKTRKIVVGTLEGVPPGTTRTFRDLRGKEAILVNTGETLVAVSTICTHLGCKVKWNQAGKNFHCPCHNGWFDAEGKVLSGPPPRPLDRYPVTTEGRVVWVEVEEPA